MYEEENELLEYETEAEETPELVMPIEPIPVRVCEPVVTIETVPQHISTRTILLTAAQPVQEVLPHDPLRVCAWLLPKVDNNVVLCHSYQQAQDPANQDPTLANPSGAIISAALTAPVRVSGTQRMWLVANTFPTHFGVIVERRSA